ncbi:AAA family ATPase [Shewanella saliphila]|uniref:Transporter n=1 Tax=Shewanella saliphila TaxID=2282698 RepID=A0ABQ2Q2K3_9GAMM|nr:ATP-binding protein [Shewanella saliphila]MCL1099882.1 ATP-binding protein [Shewanella saliphila]GGP44540.1 transporter [Shewanella saliphila]
MLIEFNVSNYRSIKDSQNFSLSKTSLNELESKNTFESSGYELLRTAVIYGPNASGKSNVMGALSFMKALVLSSAKVDVEEKLEVSPFRLNAKCRNSPSEFEATFIHQGVRYQYGFCVTQSRVTEEWLLAFPKGRAQKWFERTYDENTDSYEWYMGSALQGTKQVWQSSTKSNSLFLSTAVNLNSKQLKPVYDWFRVVLKISRTGEGWGPFVSSKLCENDQKSKVMNFLKAADMDIEDIDIIEHAFDPANLPSDMPSVFKESLIEEFKDQTLLEFKTLKKDDEGVLVDFDLESEESDGTKKLFSLAGPWIKALSEGHVLLIDELHLNLHSKLMEFLIGMFHDPEINVANGQLVFTSHDTNILNKEIFRRDQVWFCKKDELLATQLYPLTDFNPHKTRDNFEASYLAGKYGALPFIQRFEE